MNPPDQTLPMGDVSSSWFGNMLTMIVAMAVIIGLIVLLSRYVSGKRHAMRQGRPLHLEATIVLAPHKTVHVLHIGENMYIIGVGNEVTLLDKVSDQNERTRLQEALALPPPPPAPFMSWVQGWIQRRFSHNPLEQPSQDEDMRRIVTEKLRGAVISSRHMGHMEPKKGWQEPPWEP